MRAPHSLFCLSLLAVLVVAPDIASAQDDEIPPTAAEAPPLRADTSPRDELSAIDAQSAWASGLYVTAVTLHVAGVAAGVGLALGGICILECSDTHRTLQAASVASFVVAGLGLLTFIPAIVLDVESGQRRRRWREQNGTRPTAALHIGLGGLALTGTF